MLKPLDSQWPLLKSRAIASIRLSSQCQSSHVHQSFKLDTAQKWSWHFSRFPFEISSFGKRNQAGRFYIKAKLKSERYFFDAE
jgi:hypothetical protein